MRNKLLTLLLPIIGVIGLLVYWWKKNKQVVTSDLSFDNTPENNPLNTSVVKIGTAGLNLIKHWEGIHDGDLSKIGLQPKRCPAGIWTVGYGHALFNKNTGKPLKTDADLKLIAVQYPEFVNMTEAQAVDLLDKDLDGFEKQVLSLNLPFSQNQFDAVVSFVFNLGFGAFLGSTLYKVLKTNLNDKTLVSTEFKKWIYTGGKILPGLVNRRNDEIELYFS